MPAYEVAKSRHTTRRLDKKHTHSRTYVVNNPTSAGAMADAISAAPPEVIIDSKYLRITDIDTEETDHPDWFMASVSWATKDSRQSKEATQPTETNDYEESFTIGGGTEQIQEAFSQTKYGDNSADLGNSINVGDDGSVSGIDIVVPLMTFTSVIISPIPSLTRRTFSTCGTLSGRRIATHFAATLLVSYCCFRHRDRSAVRKTGK